MGSDRGVVMPASESQEMQAGHRLSCPFQEAKKGLSSVTLSLV